MFSDLFKIIEEFCAIIVKLSNDLLCAEIAVVFLEIFLKF